MAKDITFVKQSSGYILVSIGNNLTYTLPPTCLIRSEAHTDTVIVYSIDHNHLERYTVANVLSVTNAQGIIVAINDFSTLFNQLKDVCFDNTIVAELGSQNINVDANITNANIEIANEIGNPIPTTNQLLELDSTQQLINNELLIAEAVELNLFQKVYNEKIKGLLTDIKVNQTNGLQLVNDSKLQALTNEQLRNSPIAIIAPALPLPIGASTSVLQGATNTLIGITNETSPATDTAISGLNGRLQRIAQRLTSILTALGTPLQAGGSVSISNASIPVTGAFYPAIQPVSGSVSISNNLRNVYSLSTTQPITPSLVANKDIIKILGTTTPIYIKKIIFSANTTSTITTTINVVKYSSLPTGGVFTSITPTKLVSTSASNNASMSLYTTTSVSDGVSIGTIYSKKLLIAPPTSLMGNDTIIDFTTLTNEGLILLNANENIGIKLVSPPTGLSINITIIYEA